MNKSISITKPDDWHIHLRDDDSLIRTVGDIQQHFNRAIVMPNLTPPVVNCDIAKQYKNRICEATTTQFIPLMTLYLTDSTSAEEIFKGSQSGLITACKLYPAGSTTNSDSGVTQIQSIYPALEAMQQCGMPLLIHGEVTDSSIDIFDREARFIERVLHPLRIDFPELKIVFEHITTLDAAQYVEAAQSNLAATITPQHLLYDRNDMLVGGIRPHLYCLPILKRNTHRDELLRVTTSGSKKFFLGSDSAPHATHKKETDCGCAGCYSGNAIIELYTQIFDQEGALDKLEAFASFNGPDFYNLPRNTEQITLTKEPWQCPETLDYCGGSITPLFSGQQIEWKVTSIGETN